ncbi:hypothetical protein ACQEVB_00145 [Pseudonocardia sp. CA-107938]|uniref:hypothetical protein n=1 Tax=Pseudonocardia sp. CA-107938 TaxID=3240021 RepID=UPI003D903E3C
MTETIDRPRTLRRVAPAVGLFLLAPLVAEFLLGNLPISMLPAMVLLAPLYGGGALLVREVVRRAGRGVPTMLVLGLAYGLLEEGIGTQSLFNPNYAGVHLLADGFVPALGIAVPWTVFVLTLHAVFSVTAPIVVVEALVPDRARTPWLGRVGLAVAAVLFLAGLAGTLALSLAMDPFLAPVPSLVVVVVLAALLVVLALRLPRLDRRPGTVPPAWAVLGAGLVAGAVFMLVQALPGVPATLIVLPVEALLAAAAVTLSLRPGWTPRHTFALAAAALLTYAWHAFPQTPIVPVAPAVDLVGNAVFAAAAVAVLVAAARRTAQSPVENEVVAN